MSLLRKIGLPILAVFHSVVSFFGCRDYKRRERGDESMARELRSHPQTLREFPYSVLKKATRKFDLANELGHGRYGVVYRGIIPGENTAVAVRKFTRDSVQVHFLAHLPIFYRLRHKNLVPLLGWCYKKGNLLLVYGFMQNGSLDKHLYSEPPAPPLEWRRRVQILAGVASALHYLHNENGLSLVHRDIKPSNILLDAEFNARLGEFTFPGVIQDELTSELEIPGFRGSLGYIAPEFFLTSMVGLESGVFSTGVVILEVVSGRRPLGDIEGFGSLIRWVWNFYAEGNILRAVDKSLGEDYQREEARKLLVLGLACSHSNREDRPKMSDVFHVICRSAPPPEIPLTRSPFAQPSDLSEEDDNSPDFTRSISAGTSSLEMRKSLEILLTAKYSN